MQTEQGSSVRTTKGRWTPSNTRARRLVVQHKLTYGQLTRRLNERGIQCTVFNVSNVIRGSIRRPDLRMAIAELLGKPVEALWPDFHDDNAA